MDKTKMSIAAAVLFIAGLVPATAYHIDGEEETSGNFPGLSSADWTLSGGALIVCESNGDNSSRNPNADVLPGVGGLCTTGENDASGIPEPGNAAPANAAYIGLDTCEYTIAIRNAGLGPNADGFGPHNATNPGGRDCSDNTQAIPPQGSNNFNFTAEIGVYACAVDGNQALYYNRLYAYWSYADDGENLGAEGEPHYNESDVAGDREGDADPAGRTATYNNEDAWHGHVAGFVDASTTQTEGSFVTELFATGVGAITGQQNCGASPQTDDGGATGPVIVGDEW